MTTRTCTCTRKTSVFSTRLTPKYRTTYKPYGRAWRVYVSRPDESTKIVLARQMKSTKKVPFPNRPPQIIVVLFEIARVLATVTYQRVCQPHRTGSERLSHTFVLHRGERSRENSHVHREFMVGTFRAVHVFRAAKNESLKRSPRNVRFSQSNEYTHVGILIYFIRPKDVSNGRTRSHTSHVVMQFYQRRSNGEWGGGGILTVRRLLPIYQ